jgi:hypothetical protein
MGLKIDIISLMFRYTEVLEEYYSAQLTSRMTYECLRNLGSGKNGLHGPMIARGPNKYATRDRSKKRPAVMIET